MSVTYRAAQIIQFCTLLCNLSGNGVEDVEHVLCHCSALERFRGDVLQIPVEKRLGFMGDGADRDSIIRNTKLVLVGWHDMKRSTAGGMVVPFDEEAM